MERLRREIRRRALDLVGQGARADAPPPPRADDGLFGPGSASWAVHADLASMMTGGVAALLLQMLHPKALAGVWDHTDLSSGMSGRLKRTADFVAVTTYGQTDRALAAIDRVRAIHDRVEGVLPNGEPYRANDPALLTFVHVAEATSFLKAHLRYRDPFFAPARQDRYFEEMAVVALRLGAERPPRSRREARAFLDAARPSLKVDARTREVARLLFSERAPNLAMAPLYRVMFDAGVDLLPAWAARMHGKRVPLARVPALRLSVAAVGSGLRWAMAPR